MLGFSYPFKYFLKALDEIKKFFVGIYNCKICPKHVKINFLILELSHGWTNLVVIAFSFVLKRNDVPLLLVAEYFSKDI